DRSPRQIARTQVSPRDVRILQPRQRQYALALASELVRRSQEMVALERDVPAIPRLLPVTMLENDLRRSLGKKHASAPGRAVERGHELVFRFERYRVDPGVRASLGLPLQAELIGKGIKRTLGRVPVNFPDALRATQLGIVAQHRNARQQLQNRVRTRGLTVLLDR